MSFLCMNIISKLYDIRQAAICDGVNLSARIARICAIIISSARENPFDPLDKEFYMGRVSAFAGMVLYMYPEKG